MTQAQARPLPPLAALGSRALPLLAMLTLTCIWLAIANWQRGIALETDLQALLPDAEQGLARTAGDRLFAYGGDRLLLAVGAPDPETALAAARIAAQALSASPLLTLEPPGQMIEEGAQLRELLWAHRFHLLDASQRQQLAGGDTRTLQRQALRDLHSPSGWARSGTVAEDPLNLFGSFLRSLAATGTPEFVAGQWLVHNPSLATEHFALLQARLIGRAFNLDAQRAVAQLVDRAERAVGANIDGAVVLRSGIVFHAAAAASSARHEITLIGSGSSVGIAALFLLAFGRLSPLFLSLASVAFGSGCAFVLCQTWFGQVHLLTLVFGAGLTGVSVDYSLHVLTGFQATGPDRDRRRALQGLLPGLCLGLLTTVVGYGSLGRAPLPGLQQIAVFSVTGLASAWLFVVAIFPLAAPRLLRPAPSWLLALAGGPARLWQRLGRRRAGWGLATLAALSLAWCSHTINLSQDSRALYRPDPTLLAQEHLVGALVGALSPNQFLLVTAPDPQTLLRREEALTPALAALRGQGGIAGWSAVSTYLPSIARQQADYRLQRDVVYGPDGAAWAVLEQLGFEAGTEHQLARTIAAREGQPLQPGAWLSAAPDELRLLWLGQIDGQWASMIALREVRDLAALRDLATSAPGVRFVDRVAAIDRALAAQRRAAAGMLGLAYAGIALLLAWRYRRWSGALLVLIPALASLLSVTALSATGTPLTLFHLFALFLVLGLGMDYSLFLAEAGDVRNGTLLAIALSATTSMLSFGLLALSDTPMVQAFGATVMLGSLLNWVLAPLALPPGPGAAGAAGGTA